MNDCIEWQGYCQPNGYGRTAKINGKQMPAHKRAWELVYGPVDIGLDVCHKCDNRRCVNVAHLFIGTRKENMRDCANKGRTTYGEKSKSALLNWAIVNEIRVAVREFGTKQKSLALLYGVSKVCVSQVVTGNRWVS